MPLRSDQVTIRSALNSSESLVTQNFKMKLIIAVFAFAATVMAVTADRNPGIPSYVNKPNPPKHRWLPAGSPDSGSAFAEGQFSKNGNSGHADYQHTIYNNKNGQISLSGGAQKYPGTRVEPTIGVQGTFRFKRDAPSKGSIVIQGHKNMNGPERRPSWNVDYNHQIWKGKNGEVSASGGAQKNPGQRWDPTVGVQGTWRF